MIYPEEKEKKSRPNTPTADGPKNGAAADAEALALAPNGVAPDKYAWICDLCQKAKFRTFDECAEHEKTCSGTFDPEDCPTEDFALSKDTNMPEEEWYKSFAERAEKTDLNLKDIEHGGKIVLLLQIIGERKSCL